LLLYHNPWIPTDVERAPPGSAILHGTLLGRKYMNMGCIKIYQPQIDSGDPHADIEVS